MCLQHSTVHVKNAGPTVARCMINGCRRSRPNCACRTGMPLWSLSPPHLAVVMRLSSDYDEVCMLYNSSGSPLGLHFICMKRSVVSCGKEDVKHSLIPLRQASSPQPRIGSFQSSRSVTPSFPLRIDLSPSPSITLGTDKS